MKVYFISGLAADRRIFKNLQLPDGFEPVYLDWISPLENESLKNYALRLGKAINRNEKFILIGLSMGGMVAVEIAKFIKPEKLIIISSIPTAAHLPFYFRVASALYIHKLIPVFLIKNATVLKRLFSTETLEDKTLLKQIIQESDPRFIRWALSAILKWDNRIIPDNVIHIHGAKDEILPARYIKPTYLIPDAGHLMVMNRSGELNELIKKILLA